MVAFRRTNTGRNDVPVKNLFGVYYFVLILTLVGLKYTGYANEFIISVGLTCFASGIVMYLIIIVLIYLKSLRKKMERAIPEKAERAIYKNGVPTKWLTMGSIGVFIIVGMLAFIWIYRGGKIGRDLTINETIEHLNQRVSLLKVEPSQLILRGPDRSHSFRSIGKLQLNLFSQEEVINQPKSQFVISIKDNSTLPFYLFDVPEYAFATGGDLTSIPTSQICKFIDEEYDEKIPLMESIKKIPIDVSIKRWFLDVKGQVPDMIVQLIYIIRKIYKQANSRVEILVKGYADGQMTEWERPLRPGRYAYREIEVYPKFKPDSLNPLEYVYSTTTVSVPPTYANKDLPNLRARFVKEDLIDPFLAGCSTPQNVTTHILDGYEFAEINQNKRKVQIFILLF
jgi:hypothetical protein